MEQYLERSTSVVYPPLWLYPLVFVVVTAMFVLTLPFGLDILPDVVLEGSFLLLTVVLIVIIRQLDAPLLEWGFAVFLLGRLVDFLDELFVEPKPVVEPYLSGLLTTVGLLVVAFGAYSLLNERRDRIAALENRTAELALKDEAIDHAPIGITIADVTEDDEPLTYVNEGFARMTGYEPAEALGDNCRFLQGEETDPDTVARMREAIDAREETEVVVRNYHKDGTPMWNEVRLAPVDSGNVGDAVSHYIGFQRDVTERVEYKQQVESQRDDLELLNSMVRHDIRNNLQVLLANLEILAEEDVEPEQCLEAAMENARNATDLTETAQILSKAILEGEPDLSPISLGKTIEGAVEEVRSMSDSAVITVDGSIPDVRVRADEMFDSVFRNLLKNAVQHNDKDTPAVTVSAVTESEQVSISVADNGPGIPDERKEDIFAEGQKGAESSGSGIGTALVERLVERYGGTVSIRDNEPEGSVFTVTLPKAE